MQDYVTPLGLSALIAGHAACVVAAIMVLLTRSPVEPGWRRILPSAVHWFAFLGSWALGGLITWVWVFVGSTRYDAAQQMTYAFWLALAFSCVAAFAGFYLTATIRKGVYWREDEIRWRHKGANIRQSFSDVESYRRQWDGYLALRFRDGSILRVDENAHSVSDLVRAIPARAE